MLHLCCLFLLHCILMHTPNTLESKQNTHTLKFTHCFLRVLVCVYPLHSCIDRRECCPVMSQCVLPTLGLSTSFAFLLLLIKHFSLYQSWNKWTACLRFVLKHTRTWIFYSSPREVQTEVLRLFWRGTLRDRKPTVRDRRGHNNYSNHIMIRI